MSSLTAAIVGMLGAGKGAKFANITYRSKGTGEKARHHIILGASTETLYRKDIVILSELLPTLEGIAQEACMALLVTRQKSLEVGVGHNPEYVHAPENADTYVYPEGLDGVRVHKENGTVYVNGLAQHKTVLEPGIYKTVKSRPLTLAKKEIEKALPSSKFRQYILGRVNRCAMAGEVLELEAEAA